MKNINSLSSLGLTVLGGLFLSIIAQNSALALGLYFSSDKTEGLYTLDTSTGAATFVGNNSGSSSSTVGLSLSGDSSFLYGSQPIGLLTVNIDGTGMPSPSGNIQFEGLAYGNGVLYGAGIGDGIPIPGADPQFFTIDPSNGTIINNLPGLPLVDIEGLAYGNNLVYALEKRDNARLFSFDGTSWSTIGTTGVNFANAGLAYDSDLDLLYAKGSQNTALYSIDVMTGVATNIGDTGLSEGGGLAFVASEPTPPPTPSVPEPSAMLGLMILGGFGFVSGLKKDG